jgi:hypothetical protein
MKGKLDKNPHNQWRTQGVGCRQAAAPIPKLKFWKCRLLNTITSNVLHDLLFSHNQPLKWVDD